MTSRSAGGHRRYAEDELIQLRLMRDEIARGKRAAHAALSVRQLLDRAGPGRRWVDEILKAVERSDPTGIRAGLEGAHAGMGLASAVDEVLMPSLRQVGVWWEVGRCDISRERLMTETARGWLAQLTALASVEYEPSILLACGPRDSHTVGLEALAAVLAARGRGSRILGARTSELTLVSAARSASAGAVVVISQLHNHRRSAVDTIKAIDAIGVPVFFAGNAFAFAGERRNIPGTYLGETVSAASDLILDSFGVSSPRPDAPHEVA